MLLVNGVENAQAYYDSNSSIVLEISSQTQSGRFSPWLLVGYNTTQFSSVESTKTQCELKTTQKTLESPCTLYFKNSNGDVATLELEQNPHPQSHIQGDGSSDAFEIKSVDINGLSAKIYFKSTYEGQPILWKYLSSAPSVEYIISPQKGTSECCNIETSSTILSDVIGSLTFIQKKTLKRITVTFVYTEEDGQITMSVF